MEKYGEYSKLGLPLFDGTNYDFWSISMKLFLQSLGIDVWMAVENGYIVPDTTLVVGTTERILFENNAKSLYAINDGLIGSKFVKVMQCALAKETWDKLKNVYEGDGKVKGAKLQTYRR